MSNNIKEKYSSSDVLAKYKRGNKIINIVFLFIIITAVFIDALTPPVRLTSEAMIPKIIFIVIFSTICSIVKIFIKYIRIVLLRRILTEQCAPNKYGKILDGILEIEHNKVYKLRCLFDRIASFIYVGEFSKALNLLQSKKIHKDKLKKQDLLCYYVYLSQCNYALGNIDEFNQYKSMAENLIKEKEYNCAQRKSNEEAISNLNGKSAFYNNDFNKSRKIYQVVLINSVSILSRVIALYNLALIDVKENKIDCAKEKFQIVIQYGNELYQVNESKKKLKFIEQNSQL